MKEKDIITPSQEMVMNIIWSVEGPMKYKTLNEKLNSLEEDKVYQRSTVITFIRQLVDRGFLTTYRKGKAAYVIANVTKEEYLVWKMNQFLSEWFDGDKQLFQQFLLRNNLLTEVENPR